MKCLADQTTTVNGISVSFAAGIEYDLELELAPGVTRASLLNLEPSAGHWEPVATKAPPAKSAFTKPTPAVVPAADKKE
jgi:hypothetical protein